MKRIAIIGGGITGLAAAYRLHRQAETSGQPVDLQLIEASSRLGGALRSTFRDGFLLESGPDCFLSEKSRAVELCQELGLGNEVINTRTENRRSFIVRDGELHPVPEGFYLIAPSRLRPFLQSPLLSWKGKWRVLMEPLLPSKPRRDETLGSFVRRRLGQEALDWLAQPLLAGIYAADPETLSLQATFPQFLQFEEKKGGVLAGLKNRKAALRQASGARYGLFVSLRGGMQTIVDKLADALPQKSIRLNTAVMGLHRKKSGEGWELQLVKGQALEADAVCLALPAYGAAALLFSENPELSDLLKTIPYAGSATINFAFKEKAIRHPLNGFGFVTPRAEKRATLACTFVHRKFEGRAPAGSSLLRAFVGGALQEDLLQKSDEVLEKKVLKDFAEILGVIQPPLFASIQRWPKTMPQYTLGHIQRVLQIEEAVLRMPNLAVAGNWLHGVGIPDCIESGERAADRLINPSYAVSP
jgi:protoporphyrinogen/coproporphyrinogen III oxidase